MHKRIIVADESVAIKQHVAKVAKLSRDADDDVPISRGFSLFSSGSDCACGDRGWKTPTLRFDADVAFAVPFLGPVSLNRLDGLDVYIVMYTYCS